jgi:hypothetical protein
MCCYFFLWGGVFNWQFQILPFFASVFESTQCPSMQQRLLNTYQHNNKVGKSGSCTTPAAEVRLGHTTNVSQQSQYYQEPFGLQMKFLETPFSACCISYPKYCMTQYNRFVKANSLHSPHVTVIPRNWSLA